MARQTFLRAHGNGTVKLPGSYFSPSSNMYTPHFSPLKRARSRTYDNFPDFLHSKNVAK